MDIGAQIMEPPYAYHLSDPRFDLYGHHVRGFDLGIYNQIMFSLFYFPNFISWLTPAYIEEMNCFVSSTKSKILEVTL